MSLFSTTDKLPKHEALVLIICNGVNRNTIYRFVGCDESLGWFEAFDCIDGSKVKVKDVSFWKYLDKD